MRRDIEPSVGIYVLMLGTERTRWIALAKAGILLAQSPRQLTADPERKLGVYGATTMIWLVKSVAVVTVSPFASRAGLNPLAVGGVALRT